MGPDPPIVAHRERRALTPTSPPRAGPCHTSVFARDAVTTKKAAGARLGRPVAQSLRARARLRELLHDRLPSLPSPKPSTPGFTSLTRLA